MIITDTNSGKLAFVPGENAPDVMPASWRLALEDNAERMAVASRWPDFCVRVSAFDRHHLLSLTGLYTLIGAAESLQRDAAYTEIAEMEMLQAIALAAKPDSLALDLQPDQISSFWKELQTQCHVASTLDKSNDKTEIDGLARAHSTYYRNPYGDRFFDRMILAVTEEYDKNYIRDGSLISLGKSIVSLRKYIWDKFLSHLEKSRRALKGSRESVLQVLKSLHSAIPEQEFDDVFSSVSISELRKVAFQGLEDAAVDRLFIIEQEWIDSQEKAGLPMERLLASLSLQASNVTDPGIIVADNPIWYSPVVRTTEFYALYSVLTLTSFPFRCLLRLLSGVKDAKSRIEKVRGKFVESEGKRLLESSFPTAKVVLGGYWHRANGERVESDIIVLVANRLFILEAKGSLIPDRVRFGARDATTRFLKSIWGKASKQGAALADHVRQSDAPVLIADAKGQHLLTLDPNKIRSISRFGISVEQVGPMMNAPEILEKVGVINDTAIAAPCIMLAELEQVFGHISGELQRLHYLLRRAQIAQHYQIIGDEMDIFTTYVQFGFSDLPRGDHTLLILGASYTLHEYLDAEGILVLPSDSSLRSSPMFQNILRQAKQRSAEVYLELGLILMDFSLARQLAFEKAVRKAFSKKPKGDDWPVAMTEVDVPGERGAVGLVLVDPRSLPLERRQSGYNVLGAMAEQFNAVSSASIITLWKGTEAYDAVYLGGQTLRSAVRQVAPS